MFLVLLIRMFSANIHGFIERFFLCIFHSGRHLSLVTHYEALAGLCEMDQEINN
jgi:hypothetical protein